MRNLSKVGTVVSLLVIVGCEGPDQGGKTSGGVSSKVVQEKATAAVKALSDFANQNSDSFKKQMEEQLAAVDEKIRELNAKVAELGAEASEDLRDMADKMGRQSEATRKKLVELGSATGERVQALKESISAGVGDLKQSYEKADSTTQ